MGALGNIPGTRAPTKQPVVRPRRLRRELALGARLFEVRHRLGQHQAWFCHHFNVSRATYIKWERLGPPAGPSALLVRILLRRLVNRAWHQDDRRRRKDGRQKRKDSDSPFVR
jgi:hypothetical protein